MPRILTPISYSIASMLLLQKTNPRLVLFLFVIFSTLAIFILRFVIGYIITKIQIYQKRQNYTDFISR